MNSQHNYDYLFKYIVVGDSSNGNRYADVGKSCLLARYVEGCFKGDHEPTLGVEFSSKNRRPGGSNHQNTNLGYRSFFPT